MTNDPIVSGEFSFEDPTQDKQYLKMSIAGIAKSGKTRSAIKIMYHLLGGAANPKNQQGRGFAILDTEAGTSGLYWGLDGIKYKVLKVDYHHPNNFDKAIRAAYDAGFEGLIIDSMSAEHEGNHGCNQLIDEIKAHDRSENGFAAWAKVTPLHKTLMATIRSAPLHIICTYRCKEAYAQEQYVDKNGKTRNKPVKIGLEPIQAKNSAYEFDVLMDMDCGWGFVDHTTRCPYVAQLSIQYPGKQLADVLGAWIRREPMPDLGPLAAMQEGDTSPESMVRLDNTPAPAPHEAGARPDVPTEQATTKTRTRKPPAGKQQPPNPAGQPVTKDQGQATGDLAGMDGMKRIISEGQPLGYDRGEATKVMIRLFPELNSNDILKVLTTKHVEAIIAEMAAKPLQKTA